MQFRSIERRLLSRFRDKTPSSSALANLDTLLEGTHRQIAAAAEALEECDAELASSSCNLSCITQLLLLLARLSTGMSAEEVDRLRAALSPVVQVGQEQVRERESISQKKKKKIATRHFPQIGTPFNRV